ncbi:MAG: AAA family ATPase [Sedimentisphaerales bacterium]|nr:AAA family ATPase [Sedimentisphaerales bacterium]
MPEPKETQPKGRPDDEAAAKKMSEIEVLIRARYPLVYVITWEEQRLLRHVMKIGSRLGKGVFEWSVTTGLVPAGTQVQSQKHRDTATQDPLVALDNVIEHVEPALYVFKDFHPFLKGQNMAVIRRLREVSSTMQNTYKTIIIASPIFELPAELEKDLTVVDFDLPGEKEFAALVTRIIDEVKGNPKLNVAIDNHTREQIVHALLGLTLVEAENVLAKTLVEHRSLGEKSLDVIYNEKRQIIRKSGLLEYYDAEEDLSSVGGLDALKSWLLKRSVAFTDQARQFGLPAPKGVLLLGVQGCGKSLMAKTISNTWKLPLLRFDVGKVFGSLVGSSEQNIRRAIKVAESVAPVVFWIDEIDKAFRGSRGSGASTDSGTSARVFGAFLTWLSEKNKPVFVVATANDVSMLPPELLRKGRFDEIFFVDLPAFVERRAILDIHLKKRRIDPASFDMDALARACSGYSGAEIEEAIISSMFDAFYEKQPITTQRLLESIGQTVPLSKTMSEEVDGLRKWAEGRARRATSDAIAAEPGADKRKLEI